LSDRTLAERIDRDFAAGWEGTADDWWAAHPWVTTINSIAPHFTRLKQLGLIVPSGSRRRTRAGGLATPFRAASL
jgi:hypothetical protein